MAKCTFSMMAMSVMKTVDVTIQLPVLTGVADQEPNVFFERIGGFRRDDQRNGKYAQTLY